MTSMFSLLVLSVFLTVEFTSAVSIDSPVTLSLSKPVTKCPKNEVYNACYRGCIRTCKNKDIKTLRCSTACKKGCFCKKGYVRKDQKVCVKPEECPKKCGLNEVYMMCGTPCPPTCAKPEPKCTKNCVRGCFCKGGYVRDANNKCILKAKCLVPAPTCPINEVYTECDHECPPYTCAAIFRQYKCAEQKCIKRCRCMNGYSRDERGTCIPSHQCPNAKCSGVNEIFADCKLECPIAYCPTDDEPIPECSPPEFCRPGCVCAFNHRRDLNGTCIPAYECPPMTCTRQNEVYDSCPSPCLSESCWDKDNQPTTCNTFAPVTCMPRCICAKNHFRDDNGLCVPYDQCPNIYGEPENTGSPDETTATGAPDGDFEDEE